jgi:hypothetical protein
LAEAGYSRLEQLSAVAEAEIAKLHSIGPNALVKRRDALAARAFVPPTIHVTRAQPPRSTGVQFYGGEA